MKCGTQVTDTGESEFASPRHATRPERDTYIQRLRVATLGDYDIGPILGVGGMAVVYKAMDLRLQRPVAIKVMAEPPPGEDDEYVDEVVVRFHREVRMVASLVHRHIVPVYAVSDQPDLHYYVMRYIDGCPLDHLIARTFAAQGKLPFGVITRVASEVSSALGFAHGRNVIHRDIKPANIMIDRETGDSLVADFGIARVLDETHMTGAGVLGTPRYMSPEQARGEEGVELTGASDQYSLGILMYEMITGRVPFTGNPIALLSKHNQDPPPPIQNVRPDCPPELDAVVTRLLAKDPRDRFGSMHMVHDTLTRIVDVDEEMTTAVLLKTAADSANRLNAGLSRTPRSPQPVGMNVASRPARRTGFRALVLVLALGVAMIADGSWSGQNPGGAPERQTGVVDEDGTFRLALASHRSTLEAVGQRGGLALLHIDPPETVREMAAPPPEQAQDVPPVLRDPPPVPREAPPPASPGVLQVRMTPWAHAHIGDRVFSSRSWVLDTLASGVVHPLRFERPGFMTQDTTIVLEPGENRRLTIRLIRSEIK